MHASDDSGGACREYRTEVSEANGLSEERNVADVDVVVALLSPAPPSSPPPPSPPRRAIVETT